MMNINNFENEIDPKILTRGTNYFSDGAVSNLEETDTRRYEAVVEGSDNYTVYIVLQQNDDIIQHTCDCPYDLSAVCKHEVAVGQGRPRAPADAATFFHEGG